MKKKEENPFAWNDTIQKLTTDMTVTASKSEITATKISRKEAEQIGKYITKAVNIIRKYEDNSLIIMDTGIANDIIGEIGLIEEVVNNSISYWE